MSSEEETDSVTIFVDDDGWITEGLPVPSALVFKGPQSQKRKKFTSSEDVLLLPEVAARNPWASEVEGEVWDEIVSNLSALVGPITRRRARERAAKLLDQFKKDDSAALRRY